MNKLTEKHCRQQFERLYGSLHNIIKTERITNYQEAMNILNIVLSNIHLTNDGLILGKAKNPDNSDWRSELIRKGNNSILTPITHTSVEYEISVFYRNEMNIAIPFKIDVIIILFDHSNESVLVKDRFGRWIFYSIYFSKYTFLMEFMVWLKCLLKRDFDTYIIN